MHKTQPFDYQHPGVGLFERKNEVEEEDEPFSSLENSTL
jgi:hypothetical protein